MFQVNEIAFGIEVVAGPDACASVNGLPLLGGEQLPEVVGFEGDILWNTSKPDGMMRKVTDSTRIHALGWTAKTSLKEGITLAYQDYLTLKKG